jgi:hypothetical protein
MTYAGGTIAAQECIAKLTELGALVNIYSKNWISSHKDFPFFSSEDLSEYQYRSQGACEGHLLVISTSLDVQTISSLLNAAHPGFSELFGEKAPHHKPDLIFINLATEQILCVGLGRKNYFFGNAIGTDFVTINDGNLKSAIRPWSVPDSQDLTLVFMREFIKFDYANVVMNLVDSLYEFGNCARNRDYLPLMPDHIEEIIDRGPDEENLYDIDGTLMTLEEAREIIAEFEQLDEWGNDYLENLKELFPDLTWGDLNTQDY